MNGKNNEGRSQSNYSFNKHWGRPLNPTQNTMRVKLEMKEYEPEIKFEESDEFDSVEETSIPSSMLDFNPVDGVEKGWDQQEESEPCPGCSVDQSSIEDYYDGQDQVSNQTPVFSPYILPINKSWTGFHPQAPDFFSVQRIQGNTWEFIQDNKGKLKCPVFPKIDKKKASGNTVNCAGLAFRTYSNVNLKVTKKVLGTFAKKVKCSEECDRCDIRFWYWEVERRYYFYVFYLKKFENGEIGKVETPEILSPTIKRDFHIVSGQALELGNKAGKGKNPDSVYSKDGTKNPVEGPRKPSSFAPKWKVINGRKVAGQGEWGVQESKDSSIKIPAKVPTKLVGKKMADGVAEVKLGFIATVKLIEEQCWCMPIKNLKKAQNYIKKLSK